MIRTARVRLIAELALSGGIIGASITPTEALATVMVQRSIEELTRAADAVVVVTARERVSLWDHGRIVTDTTVEIDQVIRGAASLPTSVVVRSPGGIVGDMGQRVAGAPVLNRAQRYVLFIAHTSRNDYEVVGFSQGVFPIEGATVMPANVSAMEVIPSSTIATTAITVPVTGVAISVFAREIAAISTAR